MESSMNWNIWTYLRNFLVTLEKMIFAQFLRYLIIFLLTTILFWFIYLGFDKLNDEDTKARNFYQDDGAELPSVTICLKWLNRTVNNTKQQFVDRDLALPDSENWSFHDYITKSYLVKNIIHVASFHDQPADKSM